MRASAEPNPLARTHSELSLKADPSSLDKIMLQLLPRSDVAHTAAARLQAQVRGSHARKPSARLAEAVAVAEHAIEQVVKSQAEVLAAQQLVADKEAQAEAQAEASGEEPVAVRRSSSPVDVVLWSEVAQKAGVAKRAAEQHAAALTPATKKHEAAKREADRWAAAEQAAVEAAAENAASQAELAGSQRKHKEWSPLPPESQRGAGEAEPSWLTDAAAMLRAGARTPVTAPKALPAVPAAHPAQSPSPAHSPQASQSPPRPEPPAPEPEPETLQPRQSQPLQEPQQHPSSAAELGNHVAGDSPKPDGAPAHAPPLADSASPAASPVGGSPQAAPPRTMAPCTARAASPTTGCAKRAQPLAALPEPPSRRLLLSPPPQPPPMEWPSSSSSSSLLESPFIIADKDATSRLAAARLPSQSSLPSKLPESRVEWARTTVPTLGAAAGAVTSVGVCLRGVARRLGGPLHLLVVLLAVAAAAVLQAAVEHPRAWCQLSVALGAAAASTPAPGAVASEQEQEVSLALKARFM